MRSQSVGIEDALFAYLDAQLDVLLQQVRRSHHLKRLKKKYRLSFVATIVVLVVAQVVQIDAPRMCDITNTSRLLLLRNVDRTTLFAQLLAMQCTNVLRDAVLAETIDRDQKVRKRRKLAVVVLAVFRLMRVVISFDACCYFVAVIALSSRSNMTHFRNERNTWQNR